MLIVFADAGWEPVVLNQVNAQSHPDYDLFLSKLLVGEKGTQFHDGKDRYNFNYYFRWVAMAAVGGGWISQFDTLPLYSKPSFTLPNNGALSIYSHVSYMFFKTVSQYFSHVIII